MIGIKKFIINEVDFLVPSLRFVVDISIPELFIWGYYTGTGEMGGSYPVDGTGKFR